MYCYSPISKCRKVPLQICPVCCVWFPSPQCCMMPQPNCQGACNTPFCVHRCVDKTNKVCECKICRYSQQCNCFCAKRSTCDLIDETIEADIKISSQSEPTIPSNLSETGKYLEKDIQTNASSQSRGTSPRNLEDVQNKAMLPTVDEGSLSLTSSEQDLLPTQDSLPDKNKIEDEAMLPTRDANNEDENRLPNEQEDVLAKLKSIASLTSSGSLKRKTTSATPSDAAAKSNKISFSPANSISAQKSNMSSSSTDAKPNKSSASAANAISAPKSNSTSSTIPTVAPKPNKTFSSQADSMVPQTSDRLSSFQADSFTAPKFNKSSSISSAAKPESTSPVTPNPQDPSSTKNNDNKTESTSCMPLYYKMPNCRKCGTLFKPICVTKAIQVELNIETPIRSSKKCPSTNQACQCIPLLFPPAPTTACNCTFENRTTSTSMYETDKTNQIRNNNVTCRICKFCSCKEDAAEDADDDFKQRYVSERNVPKKSSQSSLTKDVLHTSSVRSNNHVGLYDHTNSVHETDTETEVLYQQAYSDSPQKHPSRSLTSFYTPPDYNPYAIAEKPNSTNIQEHSPINLIKSTTKLSNIDIPIVEKQYKFIESGTPHMANEHSSQTHSKINTVNANSSNPILKSTTNRKMKSIPNRTLQDIPNPSLKSIPNRKTQGVPNSTLKSQPNRTLQSIPNAKLRSIPNATLKNIPNATSQSIPNPILQSIPNTSSQSTPNAKLRSIPNATFKSIPNATLQSNTIPRLQGIPKPILSLPISIPNRRFESISNPILKSIPNPTLQSMQNQRLQSIQNEILQSIPNTTSQSIENPRLQSIPNTTTQFIPNPILQSIQNHRLQSIQNERLKRIPIQDKYAMPSASAKPKRKVKAKSKENNIKIKKVKRKTVDHKMKSSYCDDCCKK